LIPSFDNFLTSIKVSEIAFKHRIFEKAINKFDGLKYYFGENHGDYKKLNSFKLTKIM
jgi:hypothetical protein